MKRLKDYSAIFLLVGAILAYWIYSSIYLHGNGNSEKDVESFIQNSKIIEVDFNYQEAESYSENFGLQKKQNQELCNNLIFYSKKYNRYLNLITFENIEGQPPFSGVRRTTSLIYGGDLILKARVNNRYWNDPFYGSKDVPCPLFLMEVLSTNGQTKNIESVKKDIDVSDDLNRIFVDLYLRFFISKQELQKITQS